MAAADIARWATMIGILFSVGVMFGWAARRYVDARFSPAVWLLLVSYALYAFAAIDLIHSRLGHGFAYRSSIGLAAAAVAVTGQLWYAFTVWQETDRSRGPRGERGETGARGRRGPAGARGESG